MKIDVELPHVIELIIGDLGGDGHSKTREFVIFSNLSIEDFKSAYRLGVEIIGVDLINEIALEYEDSEISRDKMNKYITLGLIEKMNWNWSEIENEEWPNDEKGYLDFEMYIDLYLFTVLTGNGKFKYKILDYDSRIDIGGYGLFY